MMRTFVAALLACSLLAWPANAQLLLLGVGAVPTSAPAAYTGPGDLQSFAAWGGLFAYSAATRGTTAVVLCDSGDAHCVNVASDATTGLVSNAPTVGSGACNNSTHICTIKTFKDQAGGGTYDWTQTTESWRAVFTASCLGSIPCAFFSGSGFGYLSANTLTAAAWSTYTVADYTGTTTGVLLAENGTNHINVQYHTTAANQANVFGGVFSPITASDNVWHVLQGVQDPTSLTALDGAAPISASIGGNTWAQGIYLGDFCIGCGTDFTGYTAGFGVVASRLTGANLTALSANAHTILGF